MNAEAPEVTNVPDVMIMSLFYIVPFLITFIIGLVAQRRCPAGGFKPVAYMALVPGVNIIICLVLLIASMGSLYTYIVDDLYGPDKEEDLKHKKGRSTIG